MCILVVFSLLSVDVTSTQKEKEGCCDNGPDTSAFNYNGFSRLPQFSFKTQQNEETICIIFFYDTSCRSCQRAKEDLENFQQKYPSLNVKIYESADEWNLLMRYYETYNVSIEDYGTFAVFIGKNYYWERDQFDVLEEDIMNFLPTGLACPDIPTENGDENTLESVTLFAVISGGLIDGINPCAFATLIFFIAYLERIKQGKNALLYIGLVFSLAVFLGYILVGLGILEFYYQAEQSLIISDIIYLCAAAFAIFLAIFNIYDYIRVKNEEAPILQLPRFLKKRRGRVIRILTGDHRIVILVMLAFLVGLGIALLEFVCTGQVLIPVLAVIKNASAERFTAYLYLILYNFMFILPLLIILGFFYVGYKSENFGEILRSRQGTIKIFTAIFLFIIGGYMLTYFL